MRTVERVLRASRTFNVLSAVVGSDTARPGPRVRVFSFYEQLDSLPCTLAPHSSEEMPLHTHSQHTRLRPHTLTRTPSAPTHVSSLRFLLPHSRRRRPPRELLDRGHRFMARPMRGNLLH